MRRVLVALVAVADAVAAVTVVLTRGSSAPKQVVAARAVAVSDHPPVTLKEALKVARRLGPTASGRRLVLVVSLRMANGKAVDRLFQTSGTAGGAAPSAGQVRSAIAELRRAGFRVDWHAGDPLASLDGSVALAERFFHVRLSDYQLASGRRFFAPDRDATIPRSLRRAVSAVGGLDNFAQKNIAAIPRGGVSPADVLSFYNIDPLRKAGLDGSGETVVFPELSSPGDVPQLRKDLAAYAAKYHLPPFDLSTRSDPSWQPLPKGDPFGSSALGETALDLEIVHSIAPKAKLIIYEMGRNLAVGTKAELAMVKENPKAVISDSTGFCEAIIPNLATLKILQAPWVAQAQRNMTHYVASGDSGAYDCDEDHPPSVDFSSSVPVNTSVGGTSVFLAANGGYFKEVAWGNALSESGTGGGISGWYLRPSYQKGKGIPAPSGKLNRRLVPDVAGLADSNTGWFIEVGGQAHQIGGTSAAAPLWSGMTALINQDLVKNGLRRVGFANPALYAISAQQARFHAFHDVTVGNNLLYRATAGWDAATGLGSPDAAALDAAWKT